MTGTTSTSEAWVDLDTVVDEQGRAAFDLIAASVVELAGFQVAALSVVHEGRLVTVAVEGAAAARATLLGSAAPLEPVLAELEHGHDWGRFRYLPQEAQDGALSDWTWTSTADEDAAPGTWHPTDVCVALLHSSEGEVVGLLSIDLPLTGRHPLPSHRLLLDRYAAQAERTVNLALERAAMDQRVRLAETARRVVRLVTHQRDLDTVIDECQNAVQAGFESDFVALRLYGTDTHPGFGNRTLLADRETRRLVHRVAERAWTAQTTVQIAQHVDDPLLQADDERHELGAFVADRGLGATLLVPVGSVDLLLGILVVARTDPGAPWNAIEREALLEIARDVGQAVAAETARRHEAELTDELRRLSAYKSELLSTVSHELKNPLGAIAGHVELLGLATGLSEDAKFSVSSLARATDRMRRVVDDLLLLARLDDTSMPVSAEPVDLAPVIEGALELVQLATERRRLEVTVETPAHPVRALARYPDVDRVLTNLLSNAVKYTPRNGHIAISVSEHGDEVALAVTDDGIGISTEDLDGLFNEFFRSSNPRARAQPGSGLGLAICHRIATRYGGRIEVESTLGEGSTFRLVLPAAQAVAPSA